MGNIDPASVRDRQEDEQGGVPADLISYSETKALLTKQFPDITTEEIAMWVFLEPPEDYEPHPDIDPDYPPGFEDYPVKGPVYGGLISYYRSESDRAMAYHIHSRAIVGENIEWDEIKRNLHLRRFSRTEIESFSPPDRWISFSELKLRWSEIIGEDDAIALIETKLDIVAPRYIAGAYDGLSSCERP